MKPSPLAKFTLDTASGDPVAMLGNAELEVIDIGEDGRAIVECDHGALATASLEAFPDALTVQVHSSDGFGTFLFYQAEIYRATAVS